jgi:hypothetical protein
MTGGERQHAELLRLIGTLVGDVDRGGLISGRRNQGSPKDLQRFPCAIFVSSSSIELAVVQRRCTGSEPKPPGSEPGR